MARIKDRLTQRQYEALWTWTWLGWRESTPAFKATLALSGLSFLALAAVAALGV